MEDYVDIIRKNNRDFKLRDGRIPAVTSAENGKVLGTDGVDFKWVDGALSYTSGDGITIDDKEISVDNSIARVSEFANYSTTAQMNEAIAAHHDDTKANLNIVYKRADVDSLIDSKQNTLTAGDNILIVNDVISSIAKGKLDSNLVTDTTVGGIPAGTTFEAGTSLEYILRKLLITAVRTADVYIGVSTTIPTGIEGLTKLTGLTYDQIIGSSGIIQNLSCGTGAPDYIDQYPIIACTSNVKLSDWISKDTGISYLDSVVTVTIEGYNIYYKSPAIYNEDLGGEDYIFKFTEVN